MQQDPIDQKFNVVQRKHYGHTHLQSEPEPITNSLIIGEKGKVHYVVAPSAQKDFKRGKHYVPHKLTSEEIRNQKRKNFPHTYNNFGEEDMIGHNQNRHFLDAQNRRSFTYYKPSNDWAVKKAVPTAVLNSPSQYTVEQLMYRKQSVEDFRNSIPIASEGDKPYRIPDHEPGFFAKGGLIPGSTIAIQKSGKPMGKSSLVMRESSPKSTMSYAEKLEQGNLAYEMSQVHYLTDPTAKLGQRIPSWEERTGCFLVAPEDENY